ncbi:hypothetical protein [Streptomyces sp. NBC_00258]|nr:hypothetical protein [Streptomyces sp. NBC_00258]
MARAATVLVAVLGASLPDEVGRTFHLTRPWCAVMAMTDPDLANLFT